MIIIGSSSSIKIVNASIGSSPVNAPIVPIIIPTSGSKILKIPTNLFSLLI